VGQAIVKVVAVHRRSGPLTQPGLSDGRIEDRIRRIRKDKIGRNGTMEVVVCGGVGLSVQQAVGWFRVDEDDKRRWWNDRVKV